MLIADDSDPVLLRGTTCLRSEFWLCITLPKKRVLKENPRACYGAAVQAIPLNEYFQLASLPTRSQGYTIFFCRRPERENTVKYGINQYFPWLVFCVFDVETLVF